MDIAAVSIGMSQSKVMEQASLSIMKIAMDDGKESVEQMTKMMDPNVGQNFDARG